MMIYIYSFLHFCILLSEGVESGWECYSEFCIYRLNLILSMTGAFYVSFMGFSGNMASATCLWLQLNTTRDKNAGPR